jgi:DNA-directed RNA polymerase subunit RPC12/RpoP
MTETSHPSVSPQSYPCGGCGARVEFAPGTTVLRCPYCGFQQQIQLDDRQVREHPLAELATLPRKPVGAVAEHELVCQQCGARTRTNELSGRCQFCSAPLVVDPAAVGQILPEAVLPFTVDHNGLRGALRGWVSSRWFAPSALKKISEAESTKGTYLPHWTYDTNTTSDYAGARGEYYYETEYYTDSSGNRQTRRVRHTRWYPARGTVNRFFDDVLVPGTGYVPVKRLDDLAPWPLHEAVPYQPQYLAGYYALRYDVEPEAGLEEAKRRMAPVIHDDCRRDIGGDTQRVDRVDTQYADIMFKLMLLPVWVAFYVYGGKRFQVFVNGRTGEVHGERPYSAAKIALAIIAAVVVVAAVVTVVVLTKQPHR